jgi:steroid delta-isomerase-like uncharacterized protein
MTTKASIEAIIRKQADAWNRHDAEAVAQSYSEDATVIDPQYPEPLKGRDAIRKDAADFLAASPDLVFRLDRILVEGDTIAYEGVGRGTQTGPLQLPTGLIPPTNKPFEFRFAGFDRLDEAERVREEHRYFDVAGLLGQLGLLQ